MKALRTWVGGGLVILGFALVMLGVTVTNGLEYARALWEGYRRGRDLEEGDKRMMRQRLTDLTELL